MARRRLIVCAAAWALLAGPAAAQVATASGSRVVVDPETRRARVVNPLDAANAYSYQPPNISEPIVLKKPRWHKPKPPATKVAKTHSPAENAGERSGGSSGADDYVSPFAPAPEENAPAPKKTAEKTKAQPEPQSSPAANDTSIPFSFGGHDTYETPALGAQQAAAAPATARENSGTRNVRNIHIHFAPGAAEPSADVAAALQNLAGDLTNELHTTSGRLLLQGFAGAAGDKSSDARRLSLKRALAVRQLLIDSGVPSDKIEVRAMGGATDGGKPDRVDVTLHT